MYRFAVKLVCCFTALLLAANSSPGHAQTISGQTRSLLRFLDQATGVAADEAVRIALENNGELQALRRELDAARALVKQARIRPNPSLEASGTKQIGGSDNSLMLQGMLPLELGGRRAARVAVAEAELKVREIALANQERVLSADVRSKFGEALAQIKKLELVESLLASTQQGYELIAARVTEGRLAPLESNMAVVEVNRLRSMRETAAGKAEIAVFELKNLMGMRPEDPLRLRGDFNDLIAPQPPLDEAVTRALRERPDLQGSRAVAALAQSRLQQARAEGRLDASVTAGYQRTNMGFPVRGFADTGELRPVQSVFHYFTFGVQLNVPVRNRNQGAIEAAIAEREAADRRVEFGELTVRREVNAAYAKYDRAARALSIFRAGVRDQAGANLRVVWQTYELGKRSLSDYIAEQRRFLEVENELVDAALEAYLANVEIMRATNAPELK